MTSEKFVGIEISRINNLMKRDFIKTTAENDIETAGKHGWIIGFLAEHQNEDIFQKDIETQFSIRRSTVSNMLKLMEQKGYITRESVSGDARLKRIVLTRKSLDIHRRLLEQIREKEKLLRRDIPKEELDAFFSTLEKIQKNIE